MAFIRSLSGLPGPRFMQPVHAVVFELYADEKGIRNFIHVPGHVESRIDTLLEEHIDGISISLVPDNEDPVTHANWYGVELTMKGTDSELRTKQAKDVAASIRAGFRNMAKGDQVVLQWTIFKDKARESAGPDKDKVADHTFHAMARIGAVAGELDRQESATMAQIAAMRRKREKQMVRDVFAGISQTHVQKSEFIKRLVANVPDRIRARAGTLAYPIFLNAGEFLAVMGWPLDGSGGQKARKVAADSMIDTDGIVVATSNFSRTRGRPLSITPASMMMHTWILGPSGFGKSTVLHNMAAQIMNAGMGLVLIEPKGDLAHDVLLSVPHDRIKDVIWFDPTDTQRPIGLNVLAGHDVDLITSHIEGMFHNIFHDSWGDRLARILRLGVKTAAVNGLTLYDVRHLLMNAEFRAQEVAKLRKLPGYHDLILEWRWLDAISDIAVDSVINKLDNFLGSRTLRNILGQRDGLSMKEVVEQRKILLVPLPAAVIGQTNTSALGSLVRELLWDEIRRRPVEHREPIILMMDEFQNYADLNTSKSDPFAEARSYGLGLVIANQNIDQIKSVFSSVVNNAASKIVFGLEPEDGHRLKDYFLPLTTDDLNTLPKFGIAARLMTSGGKAPVATASTSPPPFPTGAGHAALAASRAAYGRSIQEVEAEFVARHKVNTEERRRPSIGRVIHEPPPD